jgi:hypothetical protein
MAWDTFSNNTSIKLEGLSKKIIQTFGNSNDLFFQNQIRPERTRFIKKLLIKLGHELKFKVYANRLNKEDLQEINQPFVNREWLFDIHFYTDSNEPYSVESLPLVAECEWNPRRKGDSIVPFSGIKYDFQKLIVSNAELRLMIFKIKKSSDLAQLETYFKNTINNYRHLENNAQFLFVAFDDKTNSFHYQQINRK